MLLLSHEGSAAHFNVMIGTTLELSGGLEDDGVLGGMLFSFPRGLLSLQFLQMFCTDFDFHKKALLFVGSMLWLECTMLISLNVNTVARIASDLWKWWGHVYLY